ncbi:uncharacterized protein [Miscanthus floridulus]|uniref:uncharacterized protein isoform X2 n=1 Tax=Miscanthus floridulus TaxID=154761 RepID=UPI00345945C9
MEPQRGEEQLARGAGGGGVNDDAGAAACLCPAAISGAARGPLFPPRHALEQEVLRRAELQLHVGGGDRRRESKMKNREWAARSRARRHAYVSELEKEASLLQAENDELRKLCEELARGAGGGGSVNDDAGAAACLCPAAISGAARGPLLPPRHALEQEVLRRAGLQLHVGGGGGDDRRRERKMKNRESAARSRARRHAYVSELEKELKEAAEVAAPATRRAPQLLRRTSSAPP